MGYGNIPLTYRWGISALRDEKSDRRSGNRPPIAFGFWIVFIDGIGVFRKPMEDLDILDVPERIAI